MNLNRDALVAFFKKPTPRSLLAVPTPYAGPVIRLQSLRKTMAYLLPVVIVFGLLFGFLQQEPAVSTAMIIMAVLIGPVFLIKPVIFRCYEEGELLWGSVGELEQHVDGSTVTFQSIRRSVYLGSTQSKEHHLGWIAAMEHAQKCQMIDQLELVKKMQEGMEVPIILHKEQYFLVVQSSFTRLGFKPKKT